MTPPIAAALCGLGIIGLFCLEWDRKSRTSPALWLAVAWACIGASRAVSQWLDGVRIVESPEGYLPGSPVDRAILSALLAAAMGVLIARRRRTAEFLRANRLIVLFFLYCMVSLTWSDFPLVAFRRWVKAAGNVVMVLVVLTDGNSSAAIKRFFARTAFLLIPISALLISYYPRLGVTPDPWTGEPYYTGVATTQNSLGVIGLVFGLGAVWRVVEAFRGATRAERIRPLATYGVVLAVNGWLLQKADSVTALVCFFAGAVFLLIAAGNGGRRSANVHGFVAALAGVALFMYLFPGVPAWLVGALGRDIRLTGRRDIWDELFKIHVNPWVGTGFESFWLGDRVRVLWDKYYFHPNQAHNGYLETYLNLGWIGVGLLAVLIASGYRNVIDGLRRNVPAAALKLAFLAVAVIYSLTEAAFKVMHPVWIAFLFAIIAVPKNQEPTSP